VFNLPADVASDIFDQTGVFDLIALSSVNKQFRSVTRRNNMKLWEKKYRKHFPLAYPALSKEMVSDWYKEFVYKCHDAFRALKPNEIEAFIKLKDGELPFPGVIDVFITDANGISFLNWASRLLPPKQMSKIYEMYRPKGFSRLKWAAACGQHQEVTSLLPSSDPHVPSTRGNTALHYAAMANSLEAGITLMQAGVSLEAMNDCGSTPLMIAAGNGNLEFVKLIANSGAHLHAIDDNQQTVLHYAACNGSLPLIEYLVSAGCHLHAVDLDGKTPIFLAVARGHMAIIHLLHHAANLFTLAHDHQTLLHVAASEGQFQSVFYLLEAGLNIDALDKNGRTPMTHACLNKRPTMVKALAYAGAKVELSGNEDGEPLRVAARAGDTAMVSQLMDLFSNDRVRYKQAEKAAGSAYRRRDNKTLFAIGIKLIEHYLSSIQTIPDHVHQSRFTLFGKTFELGYTVGRQRAAAKILLDYLKNNVVDPNLEQYKGELRSGQLGDIFNMMHFIIDFDNHTFYQFKYDNTTTSAMCTDPYCVSC